MRKGREADCDVNVPPVPEAPGAGPLPKYARGGRKEVHGDGKKGRRRMDRGGKRRRADGGPTPPPTPPNYAQNYADAASPGIGAQQSAASLSGSVPTSGQMPPQHYKRGGSRAKGGRTTPSGGVKASYRHHAENEGHTMKGGCLSGDTLVESLYGPIQISDLVGDCVLLTEHGWVSATIRCFGCQPLSEVTIAHGRERQILLSTPEHRWHTQRGVIPTVWLQEGDIFPHIEANRFRSDSLKPSEAGIASIAEQPTDPAGSMVMVDLEGRPFASRKSTFSFNDRNSSAECATSSLGSQHHQKLVMADAIFAAQSAFPTLKPVCISELNGSCSFGSFGAPTDFALRAVTATARVEFGRRLSLLTDPADDYFDTAGQRGNGASSHVPHSAIGWRVEQVRKTDILESVFCAIVPRFHRFVIAGSVLTGNSFPIQDAEDLRKAKHDVGRAHDPEAARRWINKRAGELGEPKLGE